MPLVAVGAWNCPFPWFSNTDTVPLMPALAVTMSGRPSSLTSATATDSGKLPTAKDRAGWNVPSPLPSNTDTVLSP